jgi:hypothetical protein
VDGLRLKAGCLFHALGRAAGRRAEQKSHFLRCEYAQDGITETILKAAELK